MSNVGGAGGAPDPEKILDIPGLGKITEKGLEEANKAFEQSGGNLNKLKENLYNLKGGGDTGKKVYNAFIKMIAVSMIQENEQAIKRAQQAAKNMGKSGQ